MMLKERSQPANAISHAALALTLFVTPACAQEAEPDASQVEQPAEAAPASNNPFLVQQDSAPASDDQQRPSLSELADEERQRNEETQLKLEDAKARADAAEAKANRSGKLADAVEDVVEILDKPAKPD